MTIVSKLDWVGIEQAYTTTNATLRTIGAQFGVSATRISAVAAQKRWCRVKKMGQEIEETTAEPFIERVVVEGEHNQRGLQILGQCLLKLEVAIRTSKDPREIKTVIEGVAMALGAIGRLTYEPPPSEISDIDGEIEFELAKLAARRQSRDVEDTEGEEPIDVGAFAGAADDGLHEPS